MNKTVQRMLNILNTNTFVGEHEMWLKPLWRLSNGSRSKAYTILLQFFAHWHVYPTENELDHLYAEANGGLEMEWNTL